MTRTNKPDHDKHNAQDAPTEDFGGDVIARVGAHGMFVIARSEPKERPRANGSDQ